MRVLDAVGHALGLAGSMTWQVTWSLILGFTLAAVVQAVIRRDTVIRLLGDDRPKTLAVAAGLGAASSSCSYAAVALARSLFRRGASFTAAMAFEIASTNLVIELGIILALLLSWQFTVAEFVGGPIMIVLVAVAFRLFVRQRLIDEARRQADRGLAGSMTWQVTWSLILGFTLAAVVQAVVRRDTVIRLLGDDRPKTVAVAAGLGAASSSCSYAAVALARSLFRKGASFTAAMAFEIASTNLVVELGVILALLLGWQFTLAEFVGGPIMIILMAVAFRLFVRARLIDAARQQADKGLAGSMEGHAAMDMSISGGGGFWHRLASRDGYTSVSHIFVMEWAAVIRDIVLGLLIAGAVAAWVPDSFWQHLFLTGHPLAAKVWGPIIGPVISMLSFVCSIGNVPLAAVLWNGGISFGGVVAFIFADLIIIPILVIYRSITARR